MIVKRQTETSAISNRSGFARPPYLVHSRSFERLTRENPSQSRGLPLLQRCRSRSSGHAARVKSLFQPPFVFIVLQIPFYATPFFSQPYKTPRGVGAPSLQNATEACSAEQTLFSQQLAHSLSLLSLFFRALSSIFSNLSTLRQEYRVGTPLAVLSLLGANRQIFFRRVILFLGIAAREA